MFRRNSKRNLQAKIAQRELNTFNIRQISNSGCYPILSRFSSEYLNPISNSQNPESEQQQKECVPGEFYEPAPEVMEVLSYGTFPPSESELTRHGICSALDSLQHLAEEDQEDIAHEELVLQLSGAGK